MIGRLLHIAVALLVLAGCRQEMADQPRYEPYEPGDFFDDGTSMRHPVAGTVPRHGPLHEAKRLDYDLLLESAAGGGTEIEVENGYPFPITEGVLQRGRQRFDIYCSPCHGRDGYGAGIIVQRGLRMPPSFHTDRLREAPPAHFYEVITNGFGAMYSYASRIPPADRWAIAAYVEALQLSQHATPSAVPADTLQSMESGE